MLGSIPDTRTVDKLGKHGDKEDRAQDGRRCVYPRGGACRTAEARAVLRACAAVVGLEPRHPRARTGLLHAR
ncbi:hypothetical protein EON66_02160 [archaeon]|nr:MAG: hypothetical protein EON66_02160 [archaeon]